MPINIWTQDRVPELSVTGSQSLARGISGAGHSIGQSIEKYQEKKKEREDELKRVLSAAKAAESFNKALNDDERSALGLPDPTTFATLPAADRVAMFTGAHQAVGAKRAHAELSDALEKRRATQDERMRLDTFNTRIATRPNVTPLDSTALLEAAAQSGVLGNRSIDIDALMRHGGGADSREIQPPKLIDLGGVKHTWSPTTGKYDRLDPAQSLQDRTALADRQALHATRRTILSAMSKPMLPEDKATWQQRLADIDTQLKGLGAPTKDDLDAAEAYTAQLKAERELLESKMKGGKSGGAALKAEAEDAIKRGADPAKVKARLKELGVE